MALVKFRIRRDTSANWTTADPVLALGEPGLETDTRRTKYGDGATAWTGLSYSVSSVSWGGIGGTLSDQTDLQAALNGKQGSSANLTAISGATPIADGPHAAGGITITTVGGIITAIA